MRKARDICHVVHVLLHWLPAGLHFPEATAGRRLSDCEAYGRSHLHMMLALTELTVVSEMGAGGYRLDLGVVTDDLTLMFEIKLDGEARRVARQALARGYIAPWEDSSRAVTVFGLNFVSDSRW